MVQVGTRVARASRAAAQPDRAAAASSANRALRRLNTPADVYARAGAAGAGRHHAVEHVDAARHRADQVVRRADAHQVARPVGRQQRHGRVQHGEHRRLALADRQPADRVAVEADLGQRVRRGGAQRGINAALHDAEQGRSPGAGTNACLRQRRPAHGQLHRGARLGLGGGERRALVQRHGDGGVEQMLDLHGAGRGQAMGGAVEMRLERHPVGVQLAQLGQRHDLEAAGIGQDRARPVHEPVQPAEPRDPFRAGAQHQVVGVAQHQPGAGRAHRVGGHRLHRAGGADRHEHRRLDRRHARCAARRRARRRRWRRWCVRKGGRGRPLAPICLPPASGATVCLSREKGSRAAYRPPLRLERFHREWKIQPALSLRGAERRSNPLPDEPRYARQAGDCFVAPRLAMTGTHSRSKRSKSAPPPPAPRSFAAARRRVVRNTWRGEPAAAQTGSSASRSSSSSISGGARCPTGATPPTANPVVSRTQSGSARPSFTPSTAPARADRPGWRPR